MKRPTIAFIWLVAPIAACFAQQPLTLDQAVALGVERAPEIAAQDAAVDAADAFAQSAGRLPDPAAIVGIDNVPVDGADAWSTTRDFMTMRKVGVMQEFPSAGKRRAERARALNGARIANADLAAAQVVVARETARAWIRCAAAIEALAALDALQPEFELGTAAAHGELRAGRSSTVEALEADSALAKFRSRRLEFDSEVSAARIELARWIGDDSRRPAGPMPAFDTLVTSTAGLLASAQEHAEILPLDLRVAAAHDAVDLARAARRPDWSVELTYADRGPDFSNMASLQFRVDLPIFTRNRQDPTIAGRAAELRRAEFERAAEVRSHQAELEQSIVAWQRLGAQLAQYDSELLPVARQRSRAALAAYRAGNAPLRTALAAFEDEIDITIQRTDLLRNRGMAWAFLRFTQAVHAQAGEFQ